MALQIKADEMGTVVVVVVLERRKNRIGRVVGRILHCTTGITTILKYYVIYIQGAKDRKTATYLVYYTHFTPKIFEITRRLWGGSCVLVSSQRSWSPIEHIHIRRNAPLEV
jgi:hypothetical protein